MILAPAGANGRVDLECATLAFFARTEDGACAIEHCAGIQPRKLARLAFDFAFWMGIISAIPLASPAASPAALCEPSA